MNRIETIRVLVVDDEPVVLAFVDRVLRDAGYKTALASNGHDAMKVAENLDAMDLLLTDVVMPVMNGDELVRRLREHDPNLKVLYLTGYSDGLFRENAVLSDGEAFLDKPCSPTGLLQAVSLLLFDRLDINR